MRRICVTIAFLQELQEALRLHAARIQKKGKKRASLSKKTELNKIARRVIINEAWAIFFGINLFFTA